MVVEFGPAGDILKNGEQCSAAVTGKLFALWTALGGARRQRGWRLAGWRDGGGVGEGAGGTARSRGSAEGGGLKAPVNASKRQAPSARLEVQSQILRG